MRRMQERVDIESSTYLDVAVGRRPFSESDASSLE